jgi:hypothetical protein
MSQLKTLAVAGLLAGCSAHVSEPNPPAGPPAPPATGTTNPQPAPQSVEVSLAQLSALSIFEVYGIPEDGNCYGGDTACISRERAAAAPRVATFTSAVVAAAAEPPATYGLTATVNEANLEALRNLNVVLIGQLIVAQPHNNPNCYNLPCPGDTQAADAINQERAGRLANIANAVKR